MTNKSQLEHLNKKIIMCGKCPRLVEWRNDVARVKRRAYQNEDYWGKPVPGFGDPNAKILVVGLAPGAHGSNRTGRQFTGDASGNFLFPALYKAGFANQPLSESRSDGLLLKNMYITASGRCAPPANKPTLDELDKCQPFLEQEIEIVNPKVIVCLGRIAFDRIKKILEIKDRTMKFGHGAVYISEGGINLLCSYHPSQQNTSTGKLTGKMFDDIWKKAGSLIGNA